MDSALTSRFFRFAAFLAALRFSRIALRKSERWPLSLANSSFVISWPTRWTPKLAPLLHFNFEAPGHSLPSMTGNVGRLPKVPSGDARLVAFRMLGC